MVSKGQAMPAQTELSRTQDQTCSVWTQTCSIIFQIPPPPPTRLYLLLKCLEDLPMVHIARNKNPKASTESNIWELFSCKQQPSFGNTAKHTPSCIFSKMYVFSYRSIKGGRIHISPSSTIPTEVVFNYLPGQLSVPLDQY